MNLKRQLYCAVESCCKLGADKHSIKHQENRNKSNIYSYADRRNLLNIYSQFANYLKENHPEVKLCKHLEYTHIQGFLNLKSETCSRETLKCYYSAFHKLPHIINSCYHTNLSLIGYTLPPSPNNSKIRNSTMSPKDFQKIKTYLQNSQGYGKVGLQIAKITGMRSEEICKLKYKDIHITDTSATIKVIDGKGKRSREIPVTKQEDIDYLKTLVSAPNTQNDRICAIQSNSLNKAVRRAMKATNLDKKYTNTTIHSIRKMYAQNLYNELRSQNYTPMQAWNQVSKNLGHGENRPDLIKVYLSNIN